MAAVNAFVLLPIFKEVVAGDCLTTIVLGRTGRERDGQRLRPKAHRHRQGRDVFYRRTSFEIVHQILAKRAFQRRRCHGQSYRSAAGGGTRCEKS